MKHVIVIAMYIFALVIGNSLVAHAHGDLPGSVMMADDHTTPHGSEAHDFAHCCAVSVGHCVSETVHPEADVNVIRYTIRTEARPINDDTISKSDPEVDLPPPRV